MDYYNFLSYNFKKETKIAFSVDFISKKLYNYPNKKYKGDFKMKKFLLVLTALILSAMLLTACATVNNVEEGETNQDAEVIDNTDVEVENEEADEDKVMTYAEYAAAELDSEVIIDAYVQGKQSWWDNKATVYLQDEDGAYFAYEMACSEEDYAKLEKGTHIKVKGYKAEWSGEVEIVDATFEIIDGSFIAEAIDATEWLGTDELIAHQNEFVSFKGMTVEAISFKNDQPGDDIYVTLSKDGQNYEFCVEFYLTGMDTDVYKAACTLNAGTVIDVEGFLYWYEGPNAHITSITIVE